MMRILPRLGVLLFTLAAAGDLLGQQAAFRDTACLPRHPAAIGDPLHDISRVRRLLDRHPGPDPLLLRTSSVQAITVCGPLGAAIWHFAGENTPARAALRLLPARLFTSANSAYPSGGNDGALWAGRGLNAVLSAGAALRWRALSAAVQPEFTYSQNRDFARNAVAASPLVSPYAYPWHGATIDWPERFGPDAVRRVWPGQSYLRLDAAGIGVGVSTENLWWGPARINPLLMSNTAPGFPHVFLETDRPLDIRIGRIEASAIWARLHQSKYYLTTPHPEETLLAGLTAAFTPGLFPDLTVGVARSYLRTIPPAGLALSDLFDPYLHPSANPADSLAGNNQLTSVYARFAPAGSGFEAYAELAREDNWSTLRDLITEPDHSQGYTLGFQQVVTRGEAAWRLYGELTHLSSSTTTFAGRGVVTFYIHGQEHAGYTHEGQLLGASIGPGSQSETLGLDLFRRRGTSGAFLARTRHDDDAYFAIFSPRYDFRGHDLEITGGLRQTLIVGRAVLSAQLSSSQRRNRDFLSLDGVHDAFLTERNWNLQLGASWTP